MVLQLDAETISMLLRASIYGMIGLAFWFIRSLLREFKEMQKEVTANQFSHKHTEMQLKHTDQRLDNVDNQLEKIQDCVNGISMIVKAPIIKNRRKKKRVKPVDDCADL